MTLTALRSTRALTGAASFLLALVLVSATAAAQSPYGPRPAVALTQIPSMFFNVLPVDVNGDGRADLVGARLTIGPSGMGFTAELVLRLGNGDGTFGSERLLSAPGMVAPIAAADFNRDGAVDLVVIDMTAGHDPLPIWVLPGRGDGTFGAAVLIEANGGHWQNIGRIAPNALAAVADFNGDHQLDLAIATRPDALRVYAGHGDFSFDPPAALTTGAWPEGIVAADLNNDSRPDLAVATRDGHELDLFMNGGALTFAPTVLPFDRSVLDVAVSDLNGDGTRDLVAIIGREDVDSPTTFYDNSVMVMRGNGNGTFQPPVAYPIAPRGGTTLAVADFTRDGISDIAVGSAMQGGVEECSNPFDTVAILPGDGLGRFGPAAVFQLGYDEQVPGYTGWHHALHVAQLDADAYPDLVASPGAILLTRPPAANRAPVVNAGPDQTIDNADHTVTLSAAASDPDHDWLTYAWTDEAGHVVATCPQTIVTTHAGTNTFTLTVHDGRGGSASDSMVVTDEWTRYPPQVNIDSPSFSVPVTANRPARIRFSAFSRDGATITDIDISVDRHGQTNFVPIPECTNLPAGTTECVWNDPGPPSPDAALLFHVAESDGDESNVVDRFQIVAASDQPLPSAWSHADVGAVPVAGSAGYDGAGTFTVRGSGRDIWGTADQFHFVYQQVSGDFEISARVASLNRISDWTKAGLMIRDSLAAGARHASVFSTPYATHGIAFQRRPVTGGTSLHTSGPMTGPPAWLLLKRSGDVITAYSRTSDSAEWVAIGKQTLTGLASSVVVGLAVTSHDDASPATATFDHVAVASTAAPQLSVLRPLANEQIQTNAPFTIRWLPAAGATIARFDVFFATAANGPWTPISGCTNLAPETRSCYWHAPSPIGPAFVKVVATSPAGVAGEARSGEFQIVQYATGTNGLPPGWVCGDVGAVSAAGTCSYEVEDELSPDFVVTGSGADIWGTADEFSYAAYRAYGDFSLTAKVTFVQNVNPWTKAGIMIRDWDGTGTPPANARHASFFVTPTLAKGTAFQRRVTTGGTTSNLAGPATTAEVWLKLVRRGDRIEAWYRKETTDAWSFLGEQSFSGLPYQLSAMLVVSSHADGTLATARFDNVRVDDAVQMQSADINTSTAGTTGGRWPEIVVEGDGRDIWGTADSFRFHYVKWNGNGTISVRVKRIENTNAWAKAGVMFRESLAPGSKQIMALVSPGKGVAVQYRSATGGVTASSTPVPITAPVWLNLRRFGDHFSAWYSTNPDAGEASGSLFDVDLPMTADLYVGLAVTSHASGVLATAVFDDLVISPW